MIVPAQPENLLLIAARAPVPGETKTRLGAAIGMEQAAQLYEAFLQDLAARLIPGADGAYRLGWAFSPPECDFPRIIGRVAGAAAARDACFVPQDGEDWGERQVNLLRWGHEQGYRRTILIASDSPHLTLASIEAAFAALTEADVVLGPVLDGGYYLIGVRGPHDVLTGVPMSTKDAASAVRQRARQLGLRMTTLTETFDIDLVDDLAHLRRLLVEHPSAAPATLRALRAQGLLLTPDDRPWSELAAT